MNGKKAKGIRKLAKRLAQENQTYLTKTSSKVFTDLPPPSVLSQTSTKSPEWPKSSVFQ